MRDVWDLLRGEGCEVSPLTYATAASGSRGDRKVFDAVCDALRDVRERPTILSCWKGRVDGYRVLLSAELFLFGFKMLSALLPLCCIRCSC